MRRAEFFRKGGCLRGVVKGKRWRLLTRWKNLDNKKRQQLKELFALNRRVLKAYLRKKSLERLWTYRYEGAILNYCHTKVPFWVVEAVNGNNKALFRRGRGYKNLGYLLLKAQRMAVAKTEFIVLQKAA